MGFTKINHHSLNTEVGSRLHATSETQKPTSGFFISLQGLRTDARAVG